MLLQGEPTLLDNGPAKSNCSSYFGRMRGYENYFFYFFEEKLNPEIYFGFGDKLSVIDLFLVRLRYSESL